VPGVSQNPLPNATPHFENRLHVPPQLLLLQNDTSVVAARQFVPGVLIHSPFPVKTLHGPLHRLPLTWLQTVMVVDKAARAAMSEKFLGPPTKVTSASVEASQASISAKVMMGCGLLKVYKGANEHSSL
jgi:hypothetical protein